ncbi:hypothetical protein MMC24_002769 [Lignoscripta atroalba]|nr:hypothetical protein [Lignoscripta atroalba]
MVANSLSGVPPEGTKSTTCYQSSPSSGDAACSYNGTVYPDCGLPFPLSVVTGSTQSPPPSTTDSTQYTTSPASLFSSEVASPSTDTVPGPADVSSTGPFDQPLASLSPPLSFPSEVAGIGTDTEIDAAAFSPTSMIDQPLSSLLPQDSLLAQVAGFGTGTAVILPPDTSTSPSEQSPVMPPPPASFPNDFGDLGISTALGPVPSATVGSMPYPFSNNNNNASDIIIIGTAGPTATTHSTASLREAVSGVAASPGRAPTFPPPNGYVGNSTADSTGSTGTSAEPVVGSAIISAISTSTNPLADIPTQTAAARVNGAGGIVLGAGILIAAML